MNDLAISSIEEQTMKSYRSGIAARSMMCLLAISLAISACTPVRSSNPAPTEQAILLSTSSASIQPAPTFTAILPTASLQPEPHFEIDGKPFKYLGAFVPGMYWGEWSEANDIAIVTEAKQAGFTVLNIMLPQYERTLGVYNENELKHLDHFMDVASRNGMYVILPFEHGLGMAQPSAQGEDAFANPGGVEGLVHQPALREGFKNHMAELITRINTINGQVYSQDPTILSWMVIIEIVGAPFNYPDGFPKVTAAEIANWLQENAAYIKMLDANHLVSINTGAPIDAFDSLQQDWSQILLVPDLDFIEAEDAEARIRDHPNQMSTFDTIYALRKPVVAMLSFTGGQVDRNAYCTDYKWQADTYRQAVDLYAEQGAVGFSIFSWRSSRNMGWECYSYNINTPDVVAAFQDISNELGSLNMPPQPLGFVSLVH